jgi:hypothetical protein
MPADAFSDLLIERPDVVQQIGMRKRSKAGQSYPCGARLRFS